MWGVADEKKMVNGLYNLPEHVLRKKTKNIPKNMGPTGVHLGQRNTLTSADNNFGQFFSILTRSP